MQRIARYHCYACLESTAPCAMQAKRTPKQKRVRVRDAGGFERPRPDFAKPTCEPRNERRRFTFTFDSCYRACGDNTFCLSVYRRSPSLALGHSPLRGMR